MSLTRKPKPLIHCACLLGVILPLVVKAAVYPAQVELQGNPSQWWNNYSFTLTNNTTQSLDLDGTVLNFDSNLSTSAPNWMGSGVAYPGINAQSNANAGIFNNQVTLTFSPGSDSELEPGSSIALSFGVSGQFDLALVSASANYTTLGGNTPSLDVSFTSPNPGTTYNEGDTVALVAQTVTHNTNVSKVDFLVDGALLFSDTQAPYQTEWVATGVGPHTLTVTATTTDNLSKNDSVAISVQGTPNPQITLTLDAPAANTKLVEGNSVQLLASVVTINTSVQKVDFFVNNQLVFSDTSAPYSTTWNATGLGPHTISATAVSTDSVSDSQSANISVVAQQPSAPLVNISSLSNNQSVAVNSQVPFAVEVTDADNDVAQVEFFANNQSLGVDLVAPYSIDWMPVTPGNYTLSAVATDATTLQGQSAVSVNVVEAGSGNLTCDIKQVYRPDGTECMGDDHPRRIIGYFTSWRTGQNGLPSYLAKDLPWDKLTHINYAFASVNPTTHVIQVDNTATAMTWPGVPGAEMDPQFNYQGHFNHISSLKKQYPDVKTLISVGGWAETTGFYSMTTELATCGVNFQGIDAFNASAVAFIRQYGFDGVDIDYEYPSSMKDSGNPIDFAVSNKCRAQLMGNYKVFMKKLKAALDAAGTEDNRRYMLTIAAPSSGYLLRGMEDFDLKDELDYVNIMTYDLHGAWNEYVGPQAALFDNGDDAELAAAGVYTTSQYQGIGYLNTAWAYQYFRGIFSPAQINIGVPYYTRGFQGVNGGTNGLWGSAALPNQTQCQPGTGANTPCGYGAQGIDNLWHDLDDQGNEVFAGSNPMWHALNLANADTLTFGDMPSYGPSWGLDVNDLNDKVVGDYQYHYSQALGASWLWNPTKNVFLSIEDETSLAQKLEFIIATGAGGMMVWEMAGDYAFDSNKGEYYFGDTLTTLAYNTFANATPMDRQLHTLPEPDSVIDVAVSTRDWPAGDSNYPVNPTLVLTNNDIVDIPTGVTVEFLMTTSTGDQVKDWDGAGVTITESGYTGTNFKLNGVRKDFHTGRFVLKSGASIPAGGEHSVSMVYYLPVSGIVTGVRFLVGNEVVGLKSDYPHLPAFQGSTSGGGGGLATCVSLQIDPSQYVLYPDWPAADHANGGERIRHNNTVWQAKWWSNSVPGSDGSWDPVCSY